MLCTIGALAYMMGVRTVCVYVRTRVYVRMP